MKKSILVLTNNASCHTNFQGASRIEKYFKDNNWNIACNLEEKNYDFVVIYGCGFIKTFYQKCLNTIKMLQSIQFPMDKVYILGCIAKLYYDELSQFIPKENFIEKQNEERLDLIFNNKTSIKDIAKINSMNLPVEKNDKTFYIHIVEGCLKKCTYCIIKRAMPNITSASKESILTQFRTAIHNNMRDIFMIAEDSLCYGYENGTNIFDVIDEMIKYDPDFSLTLDQFHIRWFIQYFDSIVNLCKKNYLKKLHLSIQHVNNRILKLMGREADFSKIYEKLKEFKQLCPSVDLYTDFIVGFPGETEEEHLEMLEFVKNDNCFTRIQHVCYSDNEYAASYKLPNKVPYEVALKRWMKINRVLQERSPYVTKECNNNDEEYFDKLTQLVLQQDYQICKNSYNDLDLIKEN